MQRGLIDCCILSPVHSALSFENYAYILYVSYVVYPSLYANTLQKEERTFSTKLHRVENAIEGVVKWKRLLIIVLAYERLKA